MDLNLMAEEEEEAQSGHAIDLNLLAEEEEEAQQGHAIDLNLMAEEEEEDQHGHAIDLNLMVEEEEAQQDHAIDLNLMAEEEEADQQGQEEEEGQEADAQGNPKKKELSDNERFGVHFALRVIELKDGEVHLYDKALVATLLNVCLRTVSRIWNLVYWDQEVSALENPSMCYIQCTNPKLTNSKCKMISVILPCVIFSVQILSLQILP